MAEWIETFKGAVLVSEYDSAAYMNSQIYVSRFDQATWFLLHALGVTPSTMRREIRAMSLSVSMTVIGWHSQRQAVCLPPWRD